MIIGRTVKVTTPSDTIHASTLIFEEDGLYRLPDRTIAVNLLNEKESDINVDKTLGNDPGDFKLTSVTETRELRFDLPLIIGALVVLFLELLYIKTRGDL